MLYMYFLYRYSFFDNRLCWTMIINNLPPLHICTVVVGCMIICKDAISRRLFFLMNLGEDMYILTRCCGYK